MTSLQPGALFNQRYQIEQLVSQGGFGSVYRAFDTGLNIACAIKENLDPQASVQEQFLQEASLLAALRHPGLPRVTDYFVLPGLGQYLVMDFVEGQDLQEILEARGTPLDEQQALHWITQVCSALAYLHSQTPPVIHRDIKPANIRITTADKAILIDFGIAKVYQPSKKTALGAQAVTPGYSPFEQYGRSGTDERSDIYALGATLYALLTGEEPVESVKRAVRDPLPHPQHINPKISSSTAAAIIKAMQMDPQTRYQNALDFAQALQASARAYGCTRTAESARFCCSRKPPIAFIPSFIAS